MRLCLPLSPLLFTLPTLLGAALWACGATTPVASEPTFLVRTPDGIALVQNPGASAAPG